MLSYQPKIDLFSFASSPDSNLSLIEFSLDSKRSLIGQQSLYYVPSPPDSKRSLFGEHSLFAYGITDGVLDEMSEEQRTAIISIIESLLSEGEDAN